MPKYEIQHSQTALDDVALIAKSNEQAFKKYLSFLPQLEEHPMTGTGHPEQHKHENEIWTRNINKKDRIAYTIDEENFIVKIVRILGHNDDK